MLGCWDSRGFFGGLLCFAVGDFVVVAAVLLSYLRQFAVQLAHNGFKLVSLLPCLTSHAQELHAGGQHHSFRLVFLLPFHSRKSAELWSQIEE